MPPFKIKRSFEGTVECERKQNAETTVQKQSNAKRKLDSVKTKNNQKKRKLNQTTEQRKEEKRISMRKARERLRNDPIRQEEEKRKERERYHKRKKSVVDMSERAKRSVRKKWRDQKRNQRIKLKEQTVLEKQVCDSPPNVASPTLNTLSDCSHTPLNMTPSLPEHLSVLSSSSSSSRIKSGRKRAKRNRKKLTKENQKLKDQNIILMRKLEKYKKRLQRCQSKCNSILETPRKKVKRLINKANSKEIEKRILFGEVIREQIKESFKGEKSKKKCIEVGKLLAGKIIRKYKFLEEIKLLTSQRVGRGKIATSAINKETRSSKIKLAIQKFLETDEASRMCAGKKETITRHRIKKQKRYLNNTLFNLLKVFKTENPLLNISYRTFCRYRPFWILYPTVKDRETCLCKMHENIGLVVNKLHTSNVIKEKTADEVVEKMCCDQRERECFERNCKICKGKKIELLKFTDESIKYQKWITKKFPAVIKGKEKLVQKTIKVTIETTKQKLYDVLSTDILQYMKHISNIYHQYKQVKAIKKNLSPGDMLLNFDFSENYICKYAKEIQATHFGASKHQLTMHTAILYQYKEEPKCFATLSDCNRHDSSAVVAHLWPLIKYMKACGPKLKRIHFLSDGPSAQYKNKNMFFFFFHEITKLLECDELNWHFYESGHGKGAADGIGATLKRTADSLVAMGTDIQNLDTLVTNLKMNCKGIVIETVEEEDIKNVDHLLPKTLERFKGTMQIHQIKWRKNNNILQARRLTCLQCDSHCPHFNLGNINVSKSQAPTSENAEDSLMETKIPSEIEFKELSVGNWVVVEFEGILYPGEIMRIKSKDHIEVSVMHLTLGGHFSWPDKLDQIPYSLNDVKHIIKPPIPTTSSGSRKLKYVFPEHQKIFAP